MYYFWQTSMPYFNLIGRARLLDRKTVYLQLFYFLARHPSQIHCLGYEMKMLISVNINYYFRNKERCDHCFSASYYYY